MLYMCYPLLVYLTIYCFLYRNASIQPPNAIRATHAAATATSTTTNLGELLQLPKSATTTHAHAATTAARGVRTRTRFRQLWHAHGQQRCVVATTTTSAGPTTTSYDVRGTTTGPIPSGLLFQLPSPSVLGWPSGPWFVDATRPSTSQ